MKFVKYKGADEIQRIQDILDCADIIFENYEELLNKLLATKVNVGKRFLFFFKKDFYISELRIILSKYSGSDDFYAFPVASALYRAGEINAHTLNVIRDGFFLADIKETLSSGKDEISLSIHQEAFLINVCKAWSEVA